MLIQCRFNPDYGTVDQIFSTVYCRSHRTLSCPMTLFLRGVVGGNARVCLCADGVRAEVAWRKTAAPLHQKEVVQMS